MNIPIIYEDKALLVIDKPPGIVVNKASSVSHETVQDWVEKKLRTKNLELRTENNTDFYTRGGIVHRLDKDTSGLLLIAKNPKAFCFLQAQFKERVISKKYQALVHGKVILSEGEIKASVGRLPWNRQCFGVLPGGRQAISLYKVLSFYKQNGKFYSLLEVVPLTGRTHQIRVHLKYIGRPIVADRLYAGRKTYREDMKFFPRIFLHASYLKFQHPESLKWIEFASPLPNDLQLILDRLEKMVKES